MSGPNPFPPISDGVALQEHIDKLQAELGEASRQNEAAHDELRGLRLLAL